MDQVKFVETTFKNLWVTRSYVEQLKIFKQASQRNHLFFNESVTWQSRFRVNFSTTSQTSRTS